jgi:thiol:disulfide interchange protein
MIRSLLTRFLLLLAVAALLASRPAHAGGDWNDTGIAWQPYEAGLALAKKEKKPVLLVFFTEWCPHCTNYAKVFHDPRVVEKAKQFVMIRLDKDKNTEVSDRYVPDGNYIPRTFFLSSAGELDPSITAPRDKYKYFYSESSPDGILAGMQAALTKLH